MQNSYFIKKLQPVVQLFSNAAWLMGSEVLAKISRIVTIVVLAAALTPVSYGTAMLALAFHDMLGLLLRAGTGTQIIRCAPEKLASYAKNGATIQWGMCLAIALIQYLLADIVADSYDNPDLATLLKTMALIYLFYPWVSIKVFLLQRENLMRWLSLRSGICVIAENLSIALFAVLQADILAVAYGKIVFSLLWLILFSLAPVKSYGLGFDLRVIKQLLRTSGQLLSCESLRALRLHTDTFIASKLMSPELFGIYSFAKNAGIGLSQSIGNVFNSALFPFLCKLQRQGKLTQQQSIVYRIATCIGLVFVIQALLVPFYLPLIFDQKWQITIPIVVILCLVALPNLLVDTYCSFQRAQGDFKCEILTRLLCLLISLLLLIYFSPTQPIEFAMILLASSLLWCIAIYPGFVLAKKCFTLLSFISRRKSHEY